MANFDFDRIVQSDRPVLIDFWATWCGPCVGMMPILDALQSDMGDRLDIVKLDVDQHLDLAVEQKVLGVPMFILFQNGQELWRQAGVMTKEQLKTAVEIAISTTPSIL